MKSQLTQIVQKIDVKRSILKRKSKDVILSMVRESKLSDLGRIYGTDKADQNHTFNNLSYLDIYEKYFQEYRNKNISILEIGVRSGDSLRTWKSYFKNGEIYGIDIDPNSKQFEEKRIKIEIGSQDSISFLRTCFGEKTKFDIIIDDGSHINNLTIKSFEHLFNHRLKSGGIYMIEDLRASYRKLQTDLNIMENWPGMKYNDPSISFDNDREDMNNFFFEKIKKLDHQQGNILCIHFWSMICVIIKS